MTCAASAHQRQALRNERARDRQPERMDPARPDRLDLAEMQAETPLQLGVKSIVGKRDDARGFFRFLGPDDRRAASGEGQDRKRSRGQEMLLGAAVMIALVGNRRNDGGLAVAPAVACNARALPDHGMRAVGGDQEARGDRAAIRKRDIDVT